MKNILKKKKGSSSIPYVMEFLIFVMLFAFIFDLLFVCYRDYVGSQTLNIVTRQLGVQGGVVSNISPVGYPDENGKNYTNSYELITVIKKRLNNVGIDIWTLEITGCNYNLNNGNKDTIKTYLLNSNSNIRIDYQDEMEVVLKFSHKWPSLGKVLKLNDINRSFKQLTTSEFKYNYDDWEGEH